MFMLTDMTTLNAKGRPLLVSRLPRSAHGGHRIELYHPWWRGRVVEGTRFRVGLAPPSYAGSNPAATALLIP